MGASYAQPDETDRPEGRLQESTEQPLTQVNVRDRGAIAGMSGRRRSDDLSGGRDYVHVKGKIGTRITVKLDRHMRTGAGDGNRATLTEDRPGAQMR